MTELLKDFTVVENLVDRLTPLVNTNKEGSENVFKFKKMLEPDRGIALVEIFNPSTKSFEVTKVRFRSNILRLVFAEKIMPDKIYYIKYIGKEKIKGGRSVCKFDIKEIAFKK